MVKIRSYSINVFWGRRVYRSSFYSTLELTGWNILNMFYAASKFIPSQEYVTLVAYEYTNIILFHTPKSIC